MRLVNLNRVAHLPALPPNPHGHARLLSPASEANLEMYTEEWILDFINKQILLELESNDVDSLAEETYFTDPVHRFVIPPPPSRPPPPPPVAAPVDHAAGASNVDRA